MSAIRFTSDNLAKGDLPKPGFQARSRIQRVGHKMTALAYPIRASYKRTEIGDLLLFFFILAVIRQYLWPVSSNLLAWVLTFSFALSLWYFGLRKKEEPLREEGLSYSFYLIVALPLFVIYASRF